MYNNVYISASKRFAYHNGWYDRHHGRPFNRPADKKDVRAYRNGWKDHDKDPATCAKPENDFTVKASIGNHE